MIHLLDKGVVRLALNAVVLLRDGQLPNQTLQDALDAVDALAAAGHQLAITCRFADPFSDCLKSFAPYWRLQP
jgi:hypothetical protein